MFWSHDTSEIINLTWLHLMLKLAAFPSFFSAFIPFLSYQRILPLNESAIFLGESLSTSRTKGKHNSFNLCYSYDPLGTGIKKKQPAFSLLPRRSLFLLRLLSSLSSVMMRFQKSCLRYRFSHATNIVLTLL